MILSRQPSQKLDDLFYVEYDRNEAFTHGIQDLVLH